MDAMQQNLSVHYANFREVQKWEFNNENFKYFRIQRLFLVLFKIFLS